MKRLIVRLVFVWLLTYLCFIGHAKAAIEFSDNFDDGNADGWVFPYNRYITYGPPGQWSVMNGALLQESHSDHYAALVDNLVISNQVIETQISANGYAGVVFWYDQLVYDEYANYLAVYYNYQGGIWVAEAIDGILHRYYYGGAWLEPDTWIDWRVEADSESGNVAIHLYSSRWGTVDFTHIVTTPYRTGLSGVYSGNNPGYFDNFRVTSDDIGSIPEPITLIVWSGLIFCGLVFARCRRGRSAGC